MSEKGLLSRKKSVMMSMCKSIEKTVKSMEKFIEFNRDHALLRKHLLLEHDEASPSEQCKHQITSLHEFVSQCDECASILKSAAVSSTSKTTKLPINKETAEKEETDAAITTAVDDYEPHSPSIPPSENIALDEIPSSCDEDEDVVADEVVDDEDDDDAAD
ncbi:unnamed protein product, partial [Brenthis ino]